MTLVIKKASGGVSVMRITAAPPQVSVAVPEGEPEVWRVMTLDELAEWTAQTRATCIAQWQAANPDEYVSHAEVAEEALPQDRSTRHLWALVDGAVVVDQSLVPVPQSVSRRQARQALLAAGLLASVQPAIDAVQDATQRARMQIDWEDSQEFQRDHPTLLALGSALGLDSAGIDALFIAAAAL
jgi:hypothetical protein